MTVFQYVWVPDVVGNGSTDDRAAIQTAIDAAVAGGGGIIQLPPKRMRLAAPLSLTAGNIVIAGCTRFSSVLVPDVGQNAINIADGQIPIQLRDFGIMYPTPAVSGTAAITISGDNNGNNPYSHLMRLNIQNAWFGIKTLKAAYLSIEDCLITFQARGIWIENDAAYDAGDSLVSGCQLLSLGASSLGNAALYFVSSGGLRFINNKVNLVKIALQMNLGAGVFTSDLLVTGNSFENFTVAGINFQRVGPTGLFYNTLITGNEFLATAAATYSILAVGASPWMFRMTIMGNVFDSLGAHAPPISLGNAASNVLPYANSNVFK